MMSPEQYRIISTSARIVHRTNGAPWWVESDDIAHEVACLYIEEIQRGRVIRNLSDWCARVSYHEMVDNFRRTTSAVRAAAMLLTHEWCRLVTIAPLDPEQHAIIRSSIARIQLSAPRELATILEPSQGTQIHYQRRYRARQALLRRFLGGDLSDVDLHPLPQWTVLAIPQPSL